MDFNRISGLRTHPAWRLLQADSAPLIISFLHRAFIATNQRSIAAEELATRLDDYLHHLRESFGEKRFPKKGKDYLNDWAKGEQGFLRKYYPAASVGDEPLFDLTPATEKVIEWITSFEQKQFVGTESRLLTIFRLLREIADETETDPSLRIQQLEQEKQAIERKIAQLQAGHITPHDSTRVKEKFLQAEETARQLLSDFRQVEENFRSLDRGVRERITTSNSGKGQMLDTIFSEQDAITESDQGRSFKAFWSWLMSPASQDELQETLQKVLQLPEIESLQSVDSPHSHTTNHEQDTLLEGIRFRLLEAGEKVNSTCALLVEQLRRYLDDQAWLENRRIMEIVREIEQSAIVVRQSPPAEKVFTTLAPLKPEIELPMARGLFRPALRPVIDEVPEEGEANVDTSALYTQHYVDEQQLRSQIRFALQTRTQITLAELVDLYPVKKGLSEVVAYLHIASESDRAVINTDQNQAIGWQDNHGGEKSAWMPSVIFTR
ncbi:DUF3375 domain-containing protein [uncultured Endozoicomonas sp.]|uniref:DUF3375 domain-containing protein n=1 Tax=uncultured Endozoicomonas sp. TaxID=432652 RepID=UPI00262E9EC9|nr:DUF3375 domain-containing protein [uncultured Endozoicomonas sp.]